MKKTIRFIGDVHGKFDPYKNIIKSCDASIQVGDMGVGFRSTRSDDDWMTNPPHYAMRQGDHQFIRGNHDNPAVCKRHSQYIHDGTVQGDMMFVGGALSVDKEWRTKDYDWWEDEELSIVELNEMINKYEAAKPRIMVTHEVPDSIATTMQAMSGRQKLDWPSRTRQAFDTMFQLHKPELHVYGHWHYDFDHVILGTRFVCLAELSTIDINLDDVYSGKIVPYKS